MARTTTKEAAKTTGKEQTSASAAASLKKKLFEQAQAEINKEFGKGTAMPAKGSIDVETFSSGSWAIDSILGGGFPRGRLIEIFGKEASGKTSIALNAVADVQRKGGNAVFIDVESALDPRYAAELGVDIDKLIVVRPENGEQAEMIMEKFVLSGTVDLIVLDSVAALVSAKELEGDITKDTMALRARLMSKLCSRVTAPAGKTGTTIIFINQLRSKINVMYGNPFETTGGNALRYYASQRLSVNRGKLEIDPKTGVILRTPINVRVVKNKIAPPMMTTTAYLANGKGIDKDSELFELCVKFGIIRRTGAWYKDPDTGDSLGNGAAAVIEKIRANEGGIRDKYLPLMLKRLHDVGSADDNDVLEAAVKAHDQELIDALRPTLAHHSADSTAVDGDDSEHGAVPEDADDEE